MNGDSSEPPTSEAHIFTVQLEHLQKSQQYCDECKAMVDAWPWATIRHQAVTAMKQEKCPLCQFIFSSLNLEKRVSNWEKNNLTLLESWADEGDPHQDVAKLRSPITYLASDLVVKGFGELIRNCSEKHATCRDIFGDFLANPAELPSTVLKVDDDENGRVKIYKPARGEKSSYATLSYTWGKGVRSSDREEILNKVKTDDMTNGYITSKCLPPCFRDAVELTRRLQIKYLWIDLLCVTQDNIEDRNRSISELSTIFGNSAVCIRPGNIEGVQQSFLHKKGPYPQSPTSTVRVMDSQGEIVNELKFTTKKNDATCGMERFHGPLRHRSWTVAEAFASPRHITITTHNEMAYTCLEAHHSGQSPFLWAYTLNESYTKFHYCSTIGLSWIVKYDSIPNVTPTWQQWWKIVTDIHLADVERAEDRPLMLNSIAQHPIWRDAYLHGLWRTHARELLVWKTEPRIKDHLPVVRFPGAPTWSWASMSGRASYYSLLSAGNWQFEVKDWIHGLPPVLRLPGEPATSRIILQGRSTAAEKYRKFQGQTNVWYYFKDIAETHANPPVFSEDGLVFFLLGQLNYGGGDNFYAAPSKGAASNETSKRSKKIEGSLQEKELEISNTTDASLYGPSNMHEDWPDSKAKRRSVFEWFGTKTTDFGDSSRSRIALMKQKLPRPTYRIANAFSHRKTHHVSSPGAQPPLSEVEDTPQDCEEEIGQIKASMVEDRNPDELGWRRSFEGNAESYPPEFMSLDPKPLAQAPHEEPERESISSSSESSSGQAAQPLPSFSAVKHTSEASVNANDQASKPRRSYRRNGSVEDIDGSGSRLVLGRPTLLMVLKPVSRKTYERAGILEHPCTEETIAFWSKARKGKITLV